jgi:hypothetical protein
MARPAATPRGQGAARNAADQGSRRIGGGGHRCPGRRPLKSKKPGRSETCCGIVGLFGVCLGSCNARPRDMIWLYRLLFPLALLAVMSPYYLWRMLRRGGYGGGFWHRFGLPRGCRPRGRACRRVWLQAVSVGEMLAVGPILRALTRGRGRGRPDHDHEHRLPGGARAAPRRSVCAIAYFPIDWWLFSARAWAAIAPTWPS